jgi:hypothetical protein
MVSCCQQACLRGTVAAVLLCHVLHCGKFGKVLARHCANAALGPKLACAGIAAKAAGQAQSRRMAGMLHAGSAHK